VFKYEMLVIIRFEIVSTGSLNVDIKTTLNGNFLLGIGLWTEDEIKVIQMKPATAILGGVKLRLGTRPTPFWVMAWSCSRSQSGTRNSKRALSSSRTKSMSYYFSTSQSKMCAKYASVTWSKYHERHQSKSKTRSSA